MTAIDLGIPSTPPAALAERRRSRQLVLGHPTHPVAIGGDAPVSVQSMTTTVTADINATLAADRRTHHIGMSDRARRLPQPGRCRCACAIAKKSQIPVIADIHFQPKYVFAAIDAGCAGVRVNPGNIKQFDDKVGEIAGPPRQRPCPFALASMPGRSTHGCCESTEGHPGSLGGIRALGVLVVRGARLS